MTLLPRVSVVVTAYNLARFLGRAIDSALAQDWPADALEIIVVDDGSTDETPQVLASYGERVRVIRRHPTGARARCRLRPGRGRGDYVALLDADDESRPIGCAARSIPSRPTRASASSTAT